MYVYIHIYLHHDSLTVNRVVAQCSKDELTLLSTPLAMSPRVHCNYFPLWARIVGVPREIGCSHHSCPLMAARR